MDKLCHCTLSGNVHVVSDTTCCELCESASRVELTGDNVRKALHTTEFELKKHIRAIVCQEWQNAVKKFSLRPGSVTEEVVSLITNRIDCLD